MNEWVKKSIEMANSPGYLDKLYEVYPVTYEHERTLSKEKISELRQLYEGKKDIELLYALLDLPKFPLNDPYIAFLRRKKDSIQNNPETVKRITLRIREMGFDNIVNALKQPKEFNRRMGSLFKKWIESLKDKYPDKYALVSEEEIDRQGIAILRGGDKRLLEFARKRLGQNLHKAPDFLIKVGEQYVIGEAKFLTDYGGHQNAQLQDALRSLNQDGNDRIHYVAILDGVVWIRNSGKMYDAISRLEKPAFTALLLDDFISKIGSSKLK